MVVAVGFSQWIEPPLSPHGWEALAPGHSSNHAGQLRSEMHPDWAVIKFLIEEIQRYGQSRRTAVFGASCLEPTCPLSRSPQLCPRASSLWISARRGKQSSMPQCREKVTRKQEGPGCSSEHAVNVACPLRVAVASSWRPEAGSHRRISFLGKFGLAALACFFPHPLFRQLTSALLGRAIK